MTRSGAMMDAVYTELRAAAARRLGGGQTLEPTELVHEAFLKLGDRTFESPTHFRAVASVAMRQIIIDRARRRSAAKRGGDLQQVTLSGLGIAARNEQLLDLDHALTDLEEMDPRKAKIVEMRLFGGMELNEIAAETGLSLSTIKRDWRTARAWVIRALD